MSAALPNGPDLFIVAGRPSVRDRLRDLAGSTGWTVESIEPGAEAADEVARRMPRCVLLALDPLPAAGLEACRQLKADPTTRPVPVLVVTPDAGAAVVSDALAAGADDVLAEPTADPLIVHRIQAALRARGLTERMIRTERVAVLGRLLGGIMHEARNPLHGLSLIIYLLSKKLGDAPDARELIEDLTQGVTRLKDLIETVMSIVRPSPDASAPVDVGGLIRTSVKFSADSRSRDRLKIDNQCPSDLPPVQGNSGRLLQAFLSLFEYVTRAILDGAAQGTIRITARAGIGADGNHGVEVDIHSDDLVIDSRSVEQALDPFSASGPCPPTFGLYLARDVVRRHGGQIRFECSPVGGSTFRVFLPCTGPAPAAGSVAPAAAAPQR